MEVKEISLAKGKKIYFASDFHLGVPNLESTHDRERRLNRWLDSVSSDAHSIFLLGDVFDFWFEYKKVVPKGFVRFLGKLAELSDKGIEIILFRGNHDMWMFDYLKKEINADIYSDTLELKINNHLLLIGHGDGLGPGDRSYKMLRKIFRNTLSIALFKLLPPRIGIGIAHRWSRNSRINSSKGADKFLEENEYLIKYCRQMEASKHRDYYIFGHRHLVLDVPLSDSSRYINLGEWVTESAFATYDGITLELQYFKS